MLGVPFLVCNNERVNDLMNLVKRSLVWIFFALYLYVFFVASSPLLISYDFSNFYFNASGFHDDWHPLWMKFKLNYLGTTFFAEGDCIAGMARLMHLYCALLWVVSNVLILWSMGRRFFASLSYVAMLLLILLAWPDQFRLVVADMGFFAHLFFLVALCFFAATRGAQLRWLFYLFLFLLWDVVTWRHQAVLLLPVFIWFFCRFHPKMCHYSWLRRGGVTACYSLILFASTQLLYYHILDGKRSYPQTVMMYSDIENISSMTKDGSFKEDFRREFGFTPYAMTSDTLYMKKPYVLSQYYGFTSREGRTAEVKAISYKKAYDFLREHWVASIGDHPKEFLLARSVNYLHLMYSGIVPGFVKSYIARHYPHVEIHALGGVSFSSPRPLSVLKERRQSGASYAYLIFKDRLVKSHLVALLIPVLHTLVFLWLPLSLLFSLLFQYRGRLGGALYGDSTLLSMSQLCALSSIIYLLGFLPFTPTTDIRFTSPALILGLLSLFFFLASLSCGRRSGRSLCRGDAYPVSDT